MKVLPPKSSRWEPVKTPAFDIARTWIVIDCWIGSMTTILNWRRSPNRKFTISHCERATCYDSHRSQVGQSKFERCRSRIVLMPVQPHAEPKIDKSMYDACIHVVMCPRSSYYTVMPYGDSDRSRRLSK